MAFLAKLRGWAKLGESGTLTVQGVPCLLSLEAMISSKEGWKALGLDQFRTFWDRFYAIKGGLLALKTTNREM